jgi:universal stress protein E
LAAVNFQAIKSEQRELNERILLHARRISDRYAAEFHVVNAFLDSLHFPAPGDLINRSGLPWSRIHVEQGYTDEVVSEVAVSIGADIVVLGTLNQRGGEGSLRRGNTASRVIDALRVDTLIVN